MNRPPDPGPSPTPPVHPLKRRPGLVRVWRACGYSWAGLVAAFRHEAAFRQELALGVPALAAAWWLAPGPLEAMLMSAAVVFVWIVELVNSAIEALADAVSTAHHPLLGRAKDIGSAAVMLSLALAVMVWVVVLWPGR